MKQRPRPKPVPCRDASGIVQTAVSLAREIGFDLAGVTTAEPVGDVGDLAARLTPEAVGSVRFLLREPMLRADPRAVMEGAESVICVGLSYHDGPMAALRGVAGRVARYAARRDYHRVVRSMLRELGRRLEEAAGRPVRWRACVDSAPLLEKALAARAGLGWIGRNGLLLNREYGSWLVLGELLTDLPLPEPADRDKSFPGTAGSGEAAGCGTCRACLQACPTGALAQPGVLVPSRCVSYLTIEHTGDVPPELSEKMGTWVFGCDICQLVCPYNRGAALRRAAGFAPREDLYQLDLKEVMDMNEADFAQRFAGTPILRLGLARLQRNARIAKANLGRSWAEAACKRPAERI